MLKPTSTLALLLAGSALAFPASAAAQDATAPAPVPPSTSAEQTPSDAEGQTEQPADAPADPAAQPPAEEPAPEVSVPGGGTEIIVRGRRNIVRSTPEVVSILSSQEIARTGEGNIAGSLQRVTGLSVVGGGFVYVRGLGDRYSLALLNGLPLPSPEPLRRVVPLDIFPTNVIDSTLVQKSFSANFPGEFGGGVINLTTRSVPADSFLTIGAGIGGDSVTTNNLGYVYFGSPTDWTGFDNGTRDVPPLLQAAFNSGRPIAEGADFSRADLQAIASELVNSRTSLLQRNNQIGPNFSGSLSGGHTFDLGGASLGVIATAGYSSRWRTRDTLQQTSLELDLSGDPQTSFQRVITDNRIVVNGLLGFGLELDRHKLRLTNLFIRDSIKQARLGLGTDQNAVGRDFLQQDTAWFERQLFSTQFVGEFRFGDLSLDLRGGYANSQREAPYERSFTYVRTNLPAAQDPTGGVFVNDLGGNRGSASIAFSDLNEDLYALGADVSYRVLPNVTATVGYAFSDTERTSTRRAFQFRAPNLPVPVIQLRPDALLSDVSIAFNNITLLETSAQDGTAAFEAKLRTHAGYGLVQAELFDRFRLNVGVRYEQARQTVAPIDLFNTGAAAIVATDLDNDYLLPGATLTFEATPQLQFRLSGSKTIARPQFRELVAQIYLDPESNRFFRGNPSLVDSQLWNADARAEWFFGTDQRLTGAVFYKRIDNPIETFSTIANDSTTSSSFANAPQATLYGIELEAQKYWPLGGTGIFANRRLVTIGNYTFTQSDISVSDGDTTIVNGVSQAATNFFFDGAPLTGQSDHLANLQLGLEDTSRLSQQTLLLTYASPRVTSRGPSGQPDIKERPGFQLDFVAREGVEFFGREMELKFEARNLTGRRFEEFQDSGENRIFFNRYDRGTSISVSASLKL